MTETIATLKAERDTYRSRLLRDGEGHAKAMGQLAETLARLAAFKAYVHERLDQAGVPADPESIHKAAGCRVGGRLDWLLAQLEAARMDAAGHLHNYETLRDSVKP